jgi:hypothetical protein
MLKLARSVLMGTLAFLLAYHLLPQLVPYFRFNRDELLATSVLFMIFVGLLTGRKKSDQEYATDENYSEDRPRRARYIPQKVRREVWRRDQARCSECESQERLEYDHLIPLSKGGSSTARNIRLLCERCNRGKSANI